MPPEAPPVEVEPVVITLTTSDAVVVDPPTVQVATQETLTVDPITPITDLVTTVPAVTFDEPADDDDGEQDEPRGCLISETEVDDNPNQFVYSVRATGDAPAPANVTWGALIRGATLVAAAPATPAPVTPAPATSAPETPAPAPDTTTTKTVTYPAGTAQAARIMSASYIFNDEDISCTHPATPTRDAPPARPPAVADTTTPPACTIVGTVEGAGATAGKVSVKLTITPPTGRSGHTRVAWGEGVTAPRAGNEDLLTRVFETAPAQDKKFTATLHYPTGTPREVACTMPKDLDIKLPTARKPGGPAAAPMPTFDWDMGPMLLQGVN